MDEHYKQAYIKVQRDRQEILDQNKRYREAIKNIEKGYKRILSEQSTRLLTEQYTRVSNLKFIRDEIKALEKSNLCVNIAKL